jgi:hypothetical protein
MKKPDSREFERIEMPSEMSVVYEGTSQNIATHPTDLSTKGMFIHTQRSLPEGSILRVRFRLRRIDYAMDVRAEVRHCIPNVGVGVEFLELAPEARWAIEQELRIPSE